MSAKFYEPLAFVLVRAPALPVEAYLGLRGKGRNEDLERLILADQYTSRALATGSLSLARALERTHGKMREKREEASLRAKLLCYLIRMSTRPTPFGLFAGVALGRWGSKTELRLGECRLTRTRPDMAWLYRFVRSLEADLAVRRRLRFVVNPTVAVRCGRIYLAERASTGEADGASAVSIRATNAAVRALESARQLVPYADLFDQLLTTAGATREKVERMLDELWRQTFLLSDLRPPLTANPMQFLMARLGELADLPIALEGLTRLQEMSETAEGCDRSMGDNPAAVSFKSSQDVVPADAMDTSSFQTDMMWELDGNRLNKSIADEASRAVELLFRMSPSPRGALHLAAYRSAFVSRYGSDREVPLLELLDPETGLGPPGSFAALPNSSGIPPEMAKRRRETLLGLACHALRDRQRIVELDGGALRRLETWKPRIEALPFSVDLYLFVVASSKADLDLGRFLVVLGPNHGARAAGRNLGRFADLLGADAIDALKEVARREHQQVPHYLSAELVYLPRNLRSANVVVRPAVRAYEIPIGVSSGVRRDHVIPVSDLLVGVREERLYLRWSQRPEEVRVCAGHMLNARQAPEVCRFLSEIDQDGATQFSPFDWGPAGAFPFLPRVQVGRIVLRLAQWRVDSTIQVEDLARSADFRAALHRWRDAWEVPRYVYFGLADNRLLLDLEDTDQVELFRAELSRLSRHGGSQETMVQEALPGPEDAWLEGPQGRYVSELVVSLVRRIRRASPPPPILKQAAGVNRLRLPGSEWLFVKIYGPRSWEDDLIGGQLRDFAASVLSRRLADDWFYVRYSDPDDHLRVRFKGEPDRLMRELLPALSAWVRNLPADGFCHRLSVDTYERELERYGGEPGVDISEAIFGADSRATADLLALLSMRATLLDRTELAVLSLADFLESLDFSEAERMAWLRKNVKSRGAGFAYRERKDALRLLMHERGSRESEVRRVLEDRRRTISPLSLKIRALVERLELTQTPEALYRSYLHLHCNRLLGADLAAERSVMDLLRRTCEGLFLAPVGFAMREGRAEHSSLERT